MTRPGLRLLAMMLLALAVGFMTGYRAAASMAPSHHRWMPPPVPGDLARLEGGDAHDTGTFRPIRDTRPSLTIPASGWAAVYEPDPSAAGRYATNLRDQGDGAGRVPASGGLTGFATGTWYTCPRWLKVGVRSPLLAVIGSTAAAIESLVVQGTAGSSRFIGSLWKSSCAARFGLMSTCTISMASVTTIGSPTWLSSLSTITRPFMVLSEPNLFVSCVARSIVANRVLFDGLDFAHVAATLRPISLIARVSQSADSLRGYATYYATGPDCLCAAAGPALRHGDWRGSTVTVNGLAVRLIDACWCTDRHGQPTLLDLSDEAVTALGLDPRRGVYAVTVEGLP